MISGLCQANNPVFAPLLDVYVQRSWIVNLERSNKFAEAGCFSSLQRVQITAQCYLQISTPTFIYFFYSRKCLFSLEIHHHRHHHLSLNPQGRWSTTDDFATSFLDYSVLHCPQGLGDLQARPIPRCWLVFLPHLFFCLPCLLPPFTVPCKMVLARHDEQETCPYHCSLHLFTMVRRSLSGPIGCWILAWSSSLLTQSLYEMQGVLQEHLMSMASILLWSSAVRVHDSQSYRKMDVTREPVSCIQILVPQITIIAMLQMTRFAMCVLVYCAETGGIGQQGGDADFSPAAGK